MVQFYSIDSEDEETNQQHADHPDGMALVVDREHHSTGIRMTPKVPPTFDGQSSWFEFEDLIDDWMGITTLTPERLGPSLKNKRTRGPDAQNYRNQRYRAYQAQSSWSDRLTNCSVPDMRDIVDFDNFVRPVLWCVCSSMRAN